mgnify:CR=1 FL=1
MDLKSLDAANAYGQIAKQATGPGLDAPTKGAGGASFADLVQDVIENTVSATSKSEETTALALNKQAELLDVVTAVNSAEMAVETVVAVRDKVVEAYNEIMRMPL